VEGDWGMRVGMEDETGNKGGGGKVMGKETRVNLTEMEIMNFAGFFHIRVDKGNYSTGPSPNYPCTGSSGEINVDSNHVCLKIIFLFINSYSGFILNFFKTS